MKHELITINTIETSAKIIGSRIDSVRVKNTTKKGARVYKNKMIGISGGMGQVSDDHLLKEAQDNLACGIDYPHQLETGKDHRTYVKTPMTNQELLAHTTNILGRLNKDYPQFVVNERVTNRQVTHQMTNSEGLDLKYQDATFSLSLVLQEKGSGNIFDGFVFYEGRTFDEDKFWDFNTMYLDAYLNKVDLPQGDKLPVFSLSTEGLSGILNKSFNAERMSLGSSLLKDKLNAQVFNDRITIKMSYDSQLLPSPFYDAEGKTFEGDALTLVDKGQYIQALADKKTAIQYGVAYTGGASGEYDGKPRLTGANLRFDTDAKNIKEDLKGQLAILVLVASGGDFTPSGEYATPVQLSFLFDGEKIIGKLPEFTITSTLFDMLGKDYIGTYDMPFYFVEEGGQVQGSYMKILR